MPVFSKWFNFENIKPVKNVLLTMEHDCSELKLQRASLSSVSLLLRTLVWKQPPFQKRKKCSNTKPKCHGTSVFYNNLLALLLYLINQLTISNRDGGKFRHFRCLIFEEYVKMFEA